MKEKTKAIRKYIKNLLNDLDGRGIIFVDEKLINEHLGTYGDFEVLQKTIKK
jgi:hypothetical protein